MIKRVIGLLAAAAVVAIVVLTVLHRDRYRSMIEPAPSAMRAETAPAAPVPQADSVKQSVSETPAEL